MKPVYSDELADRICEVIATQARGLHDLCDLYDFFPCKRTIFVWLDKHKYFRERYAAAKFVQCVAHEELTMCIADDATGDYFQDKKGVIRVDHENIHRSKLKVETRKWHLGVMQPKKYGMKFDDDSKDKDLSKLHDVKVDKCNLKEI